MTKFCGAVGYGSTKETAPGVWEIEVNERVYYGDVLSRNLRWEITEHQNDNITINNQISILADPYAFEHASQIRYVEWAGAKWKVVNIDIQRPRLVLTLGGVYKGEEPDDEEEAGTPDTLGGDTGES